MARLRGDLANRNFSHLELIGETYQALCYSLISIVSSLNGDDQMRKFLITVVTSNHTDIVKAGQQFEAVEDNSFLPNDKYIIVTGVINGMYLSGYLYSNGSIVYPVVNATFNATEIK